MHRLLSDALREGAMPPYFRPDCRYIEYEAIAIRHESTGDRYELQELPRQGRVHVSDHELEFRESERVCRNPASHSALQKRVFANVIAGFRRIFSLDSRPSPWHAMAFFLCLLTIAGSTGFAQDAATIPGVFAGTSVKIVERMGESVLQPGEISECVLNADGHFRFAALKPGGRLIWTRGTWAVEQFDAGGADVSFRCDDVSGTLTGRREGEELYLKFSPHPLEILAFRMKLRAPVAAPGDGWQEHVDTPAVSDSIPGVYGGTVLMSKSVGSPGNEPVGSVLLGLWPSGAVTGVVLAPTPGGADAAAILCPMGGTWRLDRNTLLIRPVWGRPGPPAAWRNMGIQMAVAEQATVLEGQTSLGGMPADGCRLEKLAHVPENGVTAAVPLVLTRIGTVAQSGDESIKSDIQFPVRVSADRRLLYVRAADDPRTWLPFPMLLGKDGALHVNEDGRCGYLVRGDDGRGEAFLVKTLNSPSGDSAAADRADIRYAAAFPARCIGTLWFFTLDIHRRSLGRNPGGAGFRRMTAAVLAEPEYPVETGNR